MSATTTHRYRELDMLRAIAIIAMVIYHAMFDLTGFFGVELPIATTQWRPFARPIAGLFLLLVGITSAISWQRTAIHKRTQKLFKRFLFIFTGACLVSLVTYINTPEIYVRFGILHLIALATLLQPLFQRLQRWNIATALAWYVLGTLLLTQLSLITDGWHALLLPLGVTYPGFSTLDYWPLLPWFSVILLGMGLGSWLYPFGSSGYLNTVRWPNWMQWLGRNSLLVYLAHQPIIFGVLWLWFSL